MVREDLRGSVPESLDPAQTGPWKNVDLSSFPAPSAHANPDGSISVTVFPFSGGRDHHPTLPEPFVWYDLHVTRLPSTDGQGKRTMFHGKSSQDPHARVLVKHSRMGMRVLDGEPVTVEYPSEVQADATKRNAKGLMFEVRGRTAKGVSVSKTTYMPEGAGPSLVKTNLISKPELRWANNTTETEISISFNPWHVGFRQYVVLTRFGNDGGATWSSDLSDSGNVPSKLKIAKGSVGTIRIVGFNAIGESAFVDMFWPDPEARKEREKYLESLGAKGKGVDDNAGYGVSKPSRSGRSNRSADTSDSTGSSSSSSTTATSTASSSNSGSSSSSSSGSSTSSSSYSSS